MSPEIVKRVPMEQGGTSYSSAMRWTKTNYFFFGRVFERVFERHLAVAKAYEWLLSHQIQ